MKRQRIKLVEMQNIINAQITKIQVDQVKNSIENVLTFLEISIILIFGINSQSFDLSLKFNDNFQSFIDLNLNSSFI